MIVLYCPRILSQSNKARKDWKESNYTSFIDIIISHIENYKKATKQKTNKEISKVF